MLIHIIRQYTKSKVKGKSKLKLTNRLLKIASLVSENKRLADIGTDHGYIPVYLLNEGRIDFAGKSKLKLTNRLLKIASLVSENKRLADIGTDHGYIPVYLLNEGRIDFAILADINKGPLENARSEVRRNKLEDKVDLRLGSGIEVLKKGEVDEVIIAGMGGILIGELLEANKEVAHSVDKLILQPMQAQEELRQYLLNNGYEILDECLEKEDFRLYEIIVAKYTGQNTIIDDEIYYEVGKRLIDNKDKLLSEFIDNKIKKYNNIIEKLGDKDSEAVISKRNLANERIEKLKKLI